MIDSKVELTTARRRLLDWFQRNARDLPWRKSRDPYRVWVSEIMLQQTQVATVIGYFERFMAALPDVRALAAADEQQVLRLWEGLGYYRRARQLHAAAKQIVAEHGGEFPTTYDAVRNLPGIGRYTAGAILSIALDQPQPIVEANTQRLYLRLTADRGSPAEKATQDRLWAFAESILPRRDAGRFNQALMEVGSLVCTPRAPECAECPLADHCKSRAAGMQHEIPTPKRPPKFEDVVEAAVIVRRGDELLVRQCGPGERWAGLWDFPRFPLVAETDAAVREELIAKTAALTGATVEIDEQLAVIKHGVTRFRITLRCFTARLVDAEPKATTSATSVSSATSTTSATGSTHSFATSPPRVPAASVAIPNATSQKWINRAQLVDLPLSATGRKIADRPW
ncbi:MAG TPA: A/G-specific adenine glycosylase [Pirellulaceae bacterium]|nr:A/G-specific adenine glycosylase [Pirellulaceae bacterium]